MDKQQIITFIAEQIATGKISKSDLVTLWGEDSNVAQQISSTIQPINPVVDKEESSNNLINTFYGIGAIIAILGVSILVAQHWDEIGFFGRILVTLGISLVAYVVALLMNNPQQKMISQAMFTIAAALAPLGTFVLLNEANISFDWSTQIITSLILMLIFGTALFISKKNILVLITVGFATWAYYAGIMKIFGFDYYNNDFLKWASMLLGASYISIAYGYQSISQAIDTGDLKEKKAIQNILYGFGTLAILGAGIFVGGGFDVFYIALIFGAFYGSVYVKSRSMLTLGAFFLMAHIIKLTSKYFVSSIGWPVALILVGFLVIGVGYLTFYLNRKFITLK
ncbi:MAG: hypothetical protein JWP09_805 [Candidatus Taylorbacteria bacterium]|nr:hypothetical protein [Candidatus Taylorbacteria bacterium]